MFGNVSDFSLLGGAGFQFVIMVYVTLDVALYPAIWDRNNVPLGSTVIPVQRGNSPQLVRGRVIVLLSFGGQSGYRQNDEKLGMDF